MNTVSGEAPSSIKILQWSGRFNREESDSGVTSNDLPSSFKELQRSLRVLLFVEKQPDIFDNFSRFSPSKSTFSLIEMELFLKKARSCLKSGGSGSRRSRRSGKFSGNREFKQMVFAA